MIVNFEYARYTVESWTYSVNDTICQDCLDALEALANSTDWKLLKTDKSLAL